jgi:hypothetical protein
MKTFLLLGLFCLLGAPAAYSQIRVEVILDQEQYLPAEALPAKVRIHNQSGQTLHLGKDEEWLTFMLENEQGNIVKQWKSPRVTEEFVLPSASRATKTVDLAPCFDLTKNGSYKVVASIRIPNWRQTFQSPPKKFYIMNGRNLDQLTFGVPSDEPGRPEIRKYILVEANRVKELTLYVRISDESEAGTYSIQSVGALIGFSHPKAQLDKWNNLHLLYQDGARSFRYVQITPDGLLLDRRTYDYTDSRPILMAAEGGRITVGGGIRRVTATDVPPPDLLEQTESPALPIAEGKTTDGKISR